MPLLLSLFPFSPCQKEKQGTVSDMFLLTSPIIQSETNEHGPFQTLCSLHLPPYLCIAF